MSNEIKNARKVLELAMEATETNTGDFDLWEIKESLQEIIDNVIGYIKVDYKFELPCGEVRIISGDHLDQLWTDSLIEQTKECYAGLSDLPAFIEIDWEATAENCKSSGMGEHFASFDGEEHSVFIGEGVAFYLFRTQ